MSSHFRIHKNSVDLYVRLTPKAHRDSVEAVKTTADGKSHIAVKVRAVPEKGRANKALENLIASHFGFTKSSVTVSIGTTSRLKTITIKGDPDEIVKMIVESGRG